VKKVGNNPLLETAPGEPAPGYPLESRGVYVSRYLSPEGNHMLNCIDRRGRLVAQVVMDDLQRWWWWVGYARGLLDYVDPTPTLKIVEEHAPAPKVDPSARNRDKRSRRGLTLANDEFC